jgi:site-specific DNA-methyltransferase (adenine-specific)
VSVEIVTGDCLAVLAGLEADSVDALVTDPPYGLEFMGQEWDSFAPERAQYHGERADTRKAIGGDKTKPASRHRVSFPMGRPTFRRCKACGRREFSGTPCRCESPEWVYEQPEGTPTRMAAFQKFCEAWARAVLRVARPGAYMAAFGGTRTFHRMIAGVEDAGWEVRDTLCWLHGQGFPKSADPVKAAWRELGPWPSPSPEAYANAERIAGRFGGFGSALKPAWEPIVLARKPLVGTAVDTLLAHGVGALNIDAARIGTSKDVPASPSQHDDVRTHGKYGAEDGTAGGFDPALGRWPANVALSHSPGCGIECEPDCAVRLLDEQSGESTSEGGNRGAGGRHGAYHPIGAQPEVSPGFGDTGGASRFFYCAKASRSEREAFLGGSSDERANTHPTVKPVDLMRWLVRLVTPPGGLVLDPFAGSGSTGVACEMEGMRFLGIERDEAYSAIAKARTAPLGGVKDRVRARLEALRVEATARARAKIGS